MINTWRTSKVILLTRNDDFFFGSFTIFIRSVCDASVRSCESYVFHGSGLASGRIAINVIKHKGEKQKIHQSAISTSNLARYEYTSGDIRYFNIPANIMSDLDFRRTA